MQRWRHLWACALVLASLLLICGTGLAQDRVQKLSNQLRTGRDFRVRTQAALALGATKSPSAVRPLCGGLRDTNRTVRAASAAALGKLGRQDGIECLSARFKVESSSVVKASIKKALQRLQGPTIGPDTEVYVAIERTKSNPDDSQAGNAIRGAMVSNAIRLSGYAVAPRQETAAQARALLRKYSKAKGFYLAPKLLKPLYAGGSLTVRISVAMFSYPGKALIGEFSVRLTQPGVGPEDKASRDDLILMAADRAMQKFAENVHRF